MNKNEVVQMVTKLDYMKEVLRLQEVINDALEIIDTKVDVNKDPETGQSIFTIDGESLIKLVKILGDVEDDKNK